MSFEERVLGSRTQVMSRSMSYQYPSTQHISSLSCGGSAGGYSQQTSSQHERTVNGRVRSVALAREEVWPMARKTREG
ncbi:hypothetical protein CROQUDRAFT_536003 [Cronartium quercuum f. sp. fusiforme G11]|uniref:Uncharacterized protein n=1 Tax=Cronartium quercuum f. sp. fusiforme G11 TaxID=708437 RepID=A0A9P6NFS5_9BASI|nr:hypothetical protein CROQUDRAFT_536003 [Cronartium quercuum f. sp. fusiforme G11]